MRAHRLPPPATSSAGAIESADLGEMEGIATIRIAATRAPTRLPLVGSHAEGSGGIQLVQSVAEAHGDATSEAAFEFALDGPALVRISLAFAYSQNPPPRSRCSGGAGGCSRCFPKRSETSSAAGSIRVPARPAIRSRSSSSKLLPGPYWFGITAYGVSCGTRTACRRPTGRAPSTSFRSRSRSGSSSPPWRLRSHDVSAAQVGDLRRCESELGEDRVRVLARLGGRRAHARAGAAHA